MRSNSIWCTTPSCCVENLFQWKKLDVFNRLTNYWCGIVAWDLDFGKNATQLKVEDKFVNVMGYCEEM